MSLFGTIKSAFSAQHRKIIQVEANGIKQEFDEQFYNLFTKMQGGMIRYSDDYIEIEDIGCKTIKKAPFIKRLEDGGRLFEDPRGFRVAISPLGEKGLISLFNFHTKEVEYNIVFNTAEYY